MPPGHDHLLHFLFSHPRLSAGWVESVLPDDLRRLVDWDSFTVASERIPGVRLNAESPQPKGEVLRTSSFGCERASGCGCWPAPTRTGGSEDDDRTRIRQESRLRGRLEGRTEGRVEGQADLWTDRILDAKALADVFGDA